MIFLIQTRWYLTVIHVFVARGIAEREFFHVRLQQHHAEDAQGIVELTSSYVQFWYDCYRLPVHISIFIIGHEQKKSNNAVKIKIMTDKNRTGICVQWVILSECHWCLRARPRDYTVAVNQERWEEGQRLSHNQKPSYNPPTVLGAQIGTEGREPFIVQTLARNYKYRTLPY